MNRRDFLHRTVSALAIMPVMPHVVPFAPLLEGFDNMIDRLSREEGVCQIAQRFLTHHPEYTAEQAIDALRTKLDRLDTDQSPLPVKLQHLIEGNFLAADVESVDGWCLARSEIELCVAAYGRRLGRLG